MFSLGTSDIVFSIELFQTILYAGISSSTLPVLIAWQEADGYRFLNITSPSGSSSVRSLAVWNNRLIIAGMFVLFRFFSLTTFLFFLKKGTFSNPSSGLAKLIPPFDVEPFPNPMTGVFQK